MRFCSQLDVLHSPSSKLNPDQLCSAAQIRDRIILSVGEQLFSSSKTIRYSLIWIPKTWQLTPTRSELSYVMHFAILEHWSSQLRVESFKPHQYRSVLTQSVPGSVPHGRESGSVSNRFTTKNFLGFELAQKPKFLKAVPVFTHTHIHTNIYTYITYIYIYIHKHTHTSTHVTTYIYT